MGDAAGLNARRCSQARVPAAAVLAAATVALAGCGHSSAPDIARSASPPSGSVGTPLLYVWRNFEETGIPDELTVYRDGSFRYRNLLHTQRSIKPKAGRLGRHDLASFRSLVREADLRRADASDVKPSRDGYRYVIRASGQTGTAADGHLHGSTRRLVRRVRVVMDRLQHGTL